MFKTSQLVFNPRVRKSPFFLSTIKHGASAFTIYNHMYLPISYEGVIEDYNNVLNGVQLWDVGVERQIQIKGPDAEALSQFLTPRDIKKCAVGQALVQKEEILMQESFWDVCLVNLDSESF